MGKLKIANKLFLYRNSCKLLPKVSGQLPMQLSEFLSPKVPNITQILFDI